MNKNPKSMEMGSYKDIFKQMLFSKQIRTPKSQIPEVYPDLGNFLRNSKDFKFIWLGHSSFLVHMDQTTILVDPVFSSHASPFPFLVRRFQPPVIKLKDLPPIDLVLISHDHYDHLDMETIIHFKDKKTHFMAPLGVGSHLTAWGVDVQKITELDWWQSTSFESITFTCAPAQHFSGRGIKRNQTLWCSWVMQKGDSKLFYSGDSGYSEHYKEIGARLGPFDAAFLENGQYNLNWPGVHQTPEEAVQAAVDVKAKAIVPVHWAMFVLSTHDWFEPMHRILAAAAKKNIPVLTPKIGELVDLGNTPSFEKWWGNQ